jgi:hypothetical protein
MKTLRGFLREFRDAQEACGVSTVERSVLRPSPLGPDLKVSE